MTTLTEPQQAWVDALRSGKYQQGQGALNAGGELCCLGVACELAVAAGITTRDERDGSEAWYGSEREAAILPEEVRAWVGLTYSDSTYAGCNQLTRDNDDGKTFEEIADIIESRPEGLFA